jgi:hypothetical protein
MALRVFFNSARNPFIGKGLFNQALTFSPRFFSTRQTLNIHNIANRRFASSNRMFMFDRDEDANKRRLIENVERLADCENYPLDEFLELPRVKKRYEGNLENAEADWKTEKYKERVADILSYSLEKFLELPRVKKRYNGNLEKAEDEWKRTRELHEAMGIPKIFKS